MTTPYQYVEHIVWVLLGISIVSHARNYTMSFIVLVPNWVTILPGFNILFSVTSAWNHSLSLRPHLAR